MSDTERLAKLIAYLQALVKHVDALEQRIERLEKQAAWEKA